MSPRSPLSLSQFWAFLLTLLLLLPLVSAKDGESDTDEPDETETEGHEGRDGSNGDEEEQEETDELEEWEEEEREVNVEVDSEEFRVESRRDSSLGRDTLRAEFDLDEARLDLKFEREDNGSGSESSLRLDDWILVEYRDENSDGAFQPGEAVVQRVTPEDASARSLEAFQADMLHRINATYGLGTPSSRWIISFLIPSQATSADGLRIAATEIKFDILIENFPYREPTSALAVQLRFRAETEFEAGEKRGTAGLFSTSSGVNGFLRWVNHSMVDGVQRPVNVSAAEAKFDSEADEFEGEALVVFSYVRGARILHDPSVGVALAIVVSEFLLQPIGNWALVGAGVAVAGLLVAVTLAPSLRYRR